MIKFNTDPASWKADTWFFTGPANVVVYSANPALYAVLNNRFTLQVNGKDNKGKHASVAYDF